MSDAQPTASPSPSPSPLAPTESPLLEADPNSINEFIQSRIDNIFNKPPLLLSDDDLKVAVEYYRRERLRFMSESAAKANKEPKPRAKKAAPTSVAQVIATSDDFI
jgi:hypothetical protein